jgi:hypothetical protein
LVAAVIVVGVVAPVPAGAQAASNDDCPTPARLGTTARETLTNRLQTPNRIPTQCSSTSLVYPTANLTASRARGLGHDRDRLAVPLDAMGIPLVGGIKHLRVWFTPTPPRQPD